MKLDNATFNAIMTNKKRFIHIDAARVGEVLAFEREDGSSTVQRQVVHVERVQSTVLASIAPVGVK